MSTHGGEETWSMTLKYKYTKLDNKRNQIPGEENKPGEKNNIRERIIHFKSHLSQYTGASLSDDSAV